MIILRVHDYRGTLIGETGVDDHHMHGTTNPFGIVIRGVVVPVTRMGFPPYLITLDGVRGSCTVTCDEPVSFGEFLSFRDGIFCTVTEISTQAEVLS